MKNAVLFAGPLYHYFRLFLWVNLFTLFRAACFLQNILRSKNQNPFYCLYHGDNMLIYRNKAQKNEIFLNKLPNFKILFCKILYNLTSVYQTALGLSTQPLQSYTHRITPEPRVKRPARGRRRSSFSPHKICLATQNHATNPWSYTWV